MSRRILPSPSRGGPSSLPPHHRPPSPLPPRKNSVKVACESCRQRRAKCSGDRPKCKACVAQARECVYASINSEETASAALKRKYNEVREESGVFHRLYNLLRSVSEADAHGILGRIRSGADVAAIVRQAEEGNLLLQLALVPETRLRYDFPYRAEMPPHLLVPDNPYLSSVIYEAVFATQPTPPESQPESQPESPSGSRSVASPYQSVYLTPYHAAEFVEPLLSDAVVSKWTEVDAGDDFLRILLHSYFLHDYLTYPSFHKDIFLRALRDDDQRFCSSLLVNAVLAEACHCYKNDPARARFWRPDTMGYKFLAEAKRLWELEDGRNRLTTVQAAMLLHVVYCFNGMDKVGISYLVQATAMAHDMQLFEEQGMKRRTEIARGFTAWSLYRWQALHGLPFFREPLVRDPPAMPLPDPIENPKWYGELWLRFPSNSAMFPTYHGHVFKAISELRHIANDMACLIFEDNEAKRSLSAAEIVGFHRRLEAWYTSLPEPVTALRTVLPCQLKMHMEYCVLLFRVSQMQTEDQILPDDLAGRTVSYALVCLETVARVYYLRHGFEFTDAFLTYFLSLLANVTIERMNGDSAGKSVLSRRRTEELATLRSTLILCAKGLHEQGLHVHVAAIIWRLVRDRMAVEDIAPLRSIINWNDEEEEETFLPHYIRSDFPLSIVRLDEDPSMSRLEYLVKQYEQIAMDVSTPESNREDLPEG